METRLVPGLPWQAPSNRPALLTCTKKRELTLTDQLLVAACLKAPGRDLQHSHLGLRKRQVSWHFLRVKPSVPSWNVFGAAIECSTAARCQAFVLRLQMGRSTEPAAARGFAARLCKATWHWLQGSCRAPHIQTKCATQAEGTR